MLIKDLDIIEIGLSSNCNNKCSWCLHFTENRNVNKLLDDSVFDNLIKELKDSEFKGVIKLNRLNEPMIEIDNLRSKAQKIKEIMPDNKVVLYTNGDFINNSTLVNLNVDSVYIYDYDNLGFDYFIDLYQYLGMSIIDQDDRYVYGMYNGVEIVTLLNWQRNYILFHKKVELNEILEEKIGFINSKTGMGVNYDGTVSTDCRLDCTQGLKLNTIIGDLSKNTLSDIISTI